MNISDTVTLRALVHALKGEIAWMRIYPGTWHGKPWDCMGVEAMQDAVRAFGDCTVRVIKPGFHSVIVVIDN